MTDTDDSVIQATPEVDDEDMLEIILDPNLRSYDALSHAPYIITSLGHLLLISAEKDFSLREHLENATFQYIKYPDSFRACVVQVSNGVWRAFDAAHNSMNQISLKSTNIGKEVKKAVKFIEKGSKNEWDIVFRCLDNIEGQCIECVEIAAFITKEFGNVANTMDELFEACIQSKGKYEDEQNETSRKKEAALIIKQGTIEKNQEMLKAKCELEKSECEEAKKNYDKAVESHPSSWKIMLFGVAGVAHDVAIVVIPSILIGKFVPTPVGSAGKPVEPSSSKPDLTIDKANVYHKTMLEDDEKKRKEAKEFLLECQIRYERYQDKMQQESMEMEKVLDDLAAFDHKILDLKKIQYALCKSMKALNTVIEHWNRFQDLFQGLRGIIGERLTGDVRRFSDTSITANEGFRDDQQIAKITHQTIIQEAVEAQAIARVVKSISSLYVYVSKRYLLNRVTFLQRIATLDPKINRAKMEEVRKELQQDGRNAKRGILKIAQQKKKELSKRIGNLQGISLHDYQIDPWFH